jgi:hypothetical protein
MAINLNNTVPAAPTGSTNVSWQRDGSGNVSAYITTSAELTGDNIDLTAQAANIAAANLEASPVGGLYRVSIYIVQTRAATTSGTLPSVQIAFKDVDSAVTETITATATNSANVVGTLAQTQVVINATAAVAITYATTGYASVGGTTLAYALHIRIEKY